MERYRAGMSVDEFDDWLTRAIEKVKEQRYRAGWVPIDEVLRRNALGTKGRLGAETAARVRRLNPKGHYTGEKIRGWNPHPRINCLSMDVIGPKRFIEKYGREAYRSIPAAAFVKQGHRKAITSVYALEHFGNA